MPSANQYLLYKNSNIKPLVLEYKIAPWSDIFPVLKQEKELLPDDSKYLHISEMIKQANNFLLMRSYLEFLLNIIDDQELRKMFAEDENRT